MKDGAKQYLTQSKDNQKKEEHEYETIESRHLKRSFLVAKLKTCRYSSWYEKKGTCLPSFEIKLPNLLADPPLVSYEQEAEKNPKTTLRRYTKNWYYMHIYVLTREIGTCIIMCEKQVE
jgi:hypothetical protein